MKNSIYLEENASRAEKENFVISLSLDDNFKVIPEKIRHFWCDTKDQFVEKIWSLTDRQIDKTIYQIQMTLAGWY